jgi:hypothetical protein
MSRPTPAGMVARLVLVGITTASCLVADPDDYRDRSPAITTEVPSTEGRADDPHS